MGELQDIRNTSENELVFSLMSQMGDGVILKDRRGCWVKANQVALRLFNVEEDAYRGRTDEELSVSSVILTEQTLELIKLPVPSGELIVLRDHSARIKAEQQLEYVLLHDALTGLPNRTFFERELLRSWEGMKPGRKLAVLYLDIDRFKYINETLGYKMGDRLLTEIAQRIQDGSGGADAVVCRMGGDEFLALARDVVSEGQVIQQAEELVERLEKPFYIEDYEFYITASVGIGFYPNEVEDPHAVMKQAEAALYQAKGKGRSTVQIYETAMNVPSFSIEKELRKACYQNQFELHYQPRVEARTGRIIGAEALLRWNHPEWGLVYPDAFISVAEMTGLIVPIGEWVLREVSRQIVEWLKQGLEPIPISIHLSAQHFLVRGFVSTLRSILEDYRVDGKWLEIEITEASLMQNSEEVKCIMEELREMGIGLSLNEFGTGSVSLSYLTRFPITSLKIERSFIIDAIENPSFAAITKSLILMAKELKLKLVAEGVENEEQLAFLHQHHCEVVQGYLFSRPLPQDQFQALFVHRVLPRRFADESVEKETETETESKRKYFRIPLFFPLGSDMTIIKIRGKEIKAGKTEVLIEDIGLGGLRFLSNIKLVLHPDIILEMNTHIMGRDIQLYGHIVWKKDVEEHGVFQYGMEFTMLEKERSELARILNEFSLKLRNSPLVPNSRFVRMDRFNYLKREG